MSNIQFAALQQQFYGNHRKSNHNHATAFLHYHDGYELYYSLNGERAYLTNNAIYSLERDWVTLTRPYAIHGTSGKAYERLIIFFSEDFLSTYFQPSLIEVFHEVFSIDAIPAEIISKQARIKELFLLIIENYEFKNEKLAAIYLGELLFLLHAAIQQTSNVNSISTIPPQMQEILGYISENFATIKNIGQVAEHFYFSKHHIFHMFKNTGFTFSEFLTKIKISHALHLLKDTKNTVASISEACGFETVAYFCIVFKKKMKMTPLEYRSWIIKSQSNLKQ